MSHARSDTKEVHDPCVLVCVGIDMQLGIDVGSDETRSKTQNRLLVHERLGQCSRCSVSCGQYCSPTSILTSPSRTHCSAGAILSQSSTAVLLASSSCCLWSCKLAWLLRLAAILASATCCDDGWLPAAPAFSVRCEA